MTVFLLKNKSEDSDHLRQDPYEDAIEEAKFVPIMDYHSVDLNGLKEALRAEDGYDGIIVTSQRAVDAMKSILSHLPPGVLNKDVYTVGPTTANRLLLLDFKNVKGAESGNGQALAHTMVSSLPNNSRLLFLAGEIHRRELPNRLIDAGHRVDTRIVYRTTRNPDVGDFLNSQARSGDWIVFFSPSHTEPVLDFVKSSQAELNLAAIGPTTWNFLKEAGLEVAAVASTPTASGLKSAIESTGAKTSSSDE